jgi:hypothetical protein
VILMLYSDCGAYGGLVGGFRIDARAEAQHQEEELLRAAEFLQKAISDIDVQAYFVDFDGLWALEVPQQ